jgi:type IV pilus assembly protein PilN
LINVNLLPKHLRRVREPGYWRVIAVLFPLLVLGALGVVQFLYGQTENNLKAEKLEKETKVAELQQYVDKQAQVLAQSEQVGILLAIRDQVMQNTIAWTNELGALLELLPTMQTASGRPSISFNSLSMQATDVANADPNRYEGKSVVAEMNVSGDVVSTEVLSQFIKSLEDSKDFGVSFQNASRNEEAGTYTYSMTIGAVGGGNNAEESQSQ